MSGLANAVQMGASSSAALVGLAAQAGVTPRQVSLARAEKPINAGAYLALCGAVGIDPVDGAPCPVKSVSPNVEWWLLSAALYITRGLRRLDQRNAAKVIGVSPSTVCRLESGKPVSIASMIKVCAFIGVHPDGYTEPHQVGQRGGVSRETPTETHCSDLEIRHGTAAHA
jgi:DNA-binding XRE family transcriptional regulator